MSRIVSRLAFSFLAFIAVGSISVRPAEASTITITGSSFDGFDQEPGQSMPTDIQAIVNGLEGDIEYHHYPFKGCLRP